MRKANVFVNLHSKKALLNNFDGDPADKNFQKSKEKALLDKYEKTNRYSVNSNYTAD